MALTEEDKQWLGSLMNANSQTLREEIQATAQTLRDELREEIVRSKDECIAAARDMQTEMLRYMANVGDGLYVRMRHVEANVGNMETAERLRLTAVEERLLRLEKRILGNPQ